MGIHGTAVLLMRYRALHNDKRILYALLAGLCTSITLTAVFVKLAMDKVIYLKNPVPAVFTHGCVAILPSSMWMIYVVPLIYDTTLFLMTVRRVWVLSKEYGSSPLMTRLAENGALHSGVLVVLMMFACVGSKTETIKIASNGSGIVGAMSSVVCSRIIFSLHTFADGEKKQSLPATADEDSVKGAHFQVPMKEFKSTGTDSIGTTTTEGSSFLQVGK
ncbi:hypothetical protein FRC07_007751 [Ceratobasidium sp. 392]|nr:hypothetical protein FRC07_007751 [Ceratobasidium sp. 392]